MGYTGEKKREYAREWIRKRRKSWIDQHGPCVQCGSNEKLEVDHIDLSKKLINPRSLWAMSSAALAVGSD